MKTQKSSDNEEVTPSKKVLKQARLPFMIISDVSPKSSPPQTRKRKLSAPEPEPVTKVGKITKENESAEESVIISDDDSKDSPVANDKVDKQLNPFVKLVDTAWKKKLQKSKAAKKKKNSKSSLKKKSKSNCSTENNENINKGSESVEEMEVDDTKEIENTISSEVKSSEDEHIKNTKTEEDTNVILLEDSNCSETNSVSHKSDTVKNQTHSDEKCNGENENIPQESELNKSNITIKNEDVVTPKRSDRIKSQGEDKNLNMSMENNCEESINSSPSTPRRSARNVSITNSQGDISLNETSNTSLTPKQVQKKIESAKKKEEREKERLEREKKRQQEKEERAKQKQEKEEQKKREREEKEEAKRKEKEEKEEQKRKEREEKEKQRELEKKLKEEKEEQKRKEREEKEEQKKKEKEAREEEKRKRQEALELEKLELEQKKKKAAEAFVSFFVPKQKGDKDQVTVGPVSQNSLLSSFTLKSDMRLAPTIRVNLDAEKQKALDNHLKEQNVPEKSLYIKNLKNGVQKPLSNGRTWPLNDKDDQDEQDDVMIIEDELPPVDGAGEIISCDTTIREKLRPKLLAFHENRRPPYWGTWRKKSSSINPRRPFSTDEKLLDYEVDSDEEWEEEQDGESIDGSVANSDDEQDNDEYEVDNEVFVPHGYLSDEEGTMDGDDVLSLSPETQKARLKHLEDEFESELKKPMEKLKPRLYGLIWETENGKPEKCVDALWNYFGKLAMIMDDPTPLLQPSNETEEPEKKKVKKKKAPEGEEQSPKNEKKKKKSEEKDGKKPKTDNKKVPEKKNQPGINTFLKKIKTS